MKTLTLCIFAVMITFNGFAQSDTLRKRKNELNFGFFNAFNLSGGNNFGIGFKHQYKNGAFRIRTTFSISNSHENNNIYSYSTDQNGNIHNVSLYNYVDKYINIQPRIGYEFHQSYNKLQMFYGADLVGSIISSNNTYDYYYNQTITHSDLNKYSSWGVGISPLIGVTYRFNSSFSVSTETNLTILYSQGKTEQSFSPVRDTLPNTTNNAISTQLGPLGLISMDFHF